MVAEPITSKQHSATSLALYFSLAFLIMVLLSFLGVLGIADPQSAYLLCFGDEPFDGSQW